MDCWKGKYLTQNHEKYIQKSSRETREGVVKKESRIVERDFRAKDSNEKEIVEILSYKLGISEDELFTYVDNL